MKVLLVIACWTIALMVAAGCGERPTIFKSQLKCTLDGKPSFQSYPWVYVSLTRGGSYSIINRDRHEIYYTPKGGELCEVYNLLGPAR